MTRDRMPEDFEGEVRAAFKGHLSALDSIQPPHAERAQFRRVARRAPAPVRAGQTGRWLGAGVALAAVVAVAAVAVTAGPRWGSTGSTSAASAATIQPNASATPPSGAATASPIETRVVASFSDDEMGPLVLGPDGAAYVIDRTLATVYRVDLRSGARQAVVSAAQTPPVGGHTVARPRLLASVGGDVLILDEGNALWRWRPAGDGSTRGVLLQVPISDSAGWGAAPTAMAAYPLGTEGFYALYLALPDAGQVVRYSPNADGSGFVAALRVDELASPEDVAAVTDLYVDGSLYLVDLGSIVRLDAGHKLAWGPATAVAPAPGSSFYTRLTSDDPAEDAGNLIAYDQRAARLDVYEKSDRTLIGRYVAGDGSLADAQGLAAMSSSGQTRVLWTVRGRIMEAVLPASAPSATASAAPSVTATHATSGVWSGLTGESAPALAQSVDGATWTSLPVTGSTDQLGPVSAVVSGGVFAPKPPTEALVFLEAVP
jgi:hypothetical protein